MKNETETLFDMIDPFNPGNRVTGIIYRTNDKYGSLLIKTVNDKPCEQFIHATPKFTYPGNSTSSKSYKKGLFPKFVTVTVYDKLDGTNIFMFKYRDHEGKNFISFKTRLVPFLKEAGFKDWIVMWKKMEERYKDKIDLVKKLLLSVKEMSGVAFEMYGSANKILIEYNVPLDIAMLYYIDWNGKIHEPKEINSVVCCLNPVSNSKLPEPKELAKFSDKTDPDEIYITMLDVFEQNFIENKSVEGCMFYINTGKDIIAWKCKPPSVLAAQCEGNKMVGYDDAYTTAMNAMESVDSIDDLSKETYSLLAETYDETIIELSKERIDKAIIDAKKYVLFRKEVVEKFKSLGLKWNNITSKSPKQDKDIVMRSMMKECKGANPASIFNALIDYFSIFGQLP